MIVVEDNYLDKEDFAWLQEYCKKQEFKLLDGGDKQFLAIETPERILDELELETHNIIFSFIRKAHKDFDTEPRIHSDGIILDKYTDLASVLYINESEGVSKNGTMFYDHKELGQGLPKDVSCEQYNEVLKDSNKFHKFIETDRVYSRPNRMLTYDAQNFHAKFPAQIQQGERIVLVTFYEENR